MAATSTASYTTDATSAPRATAAVVGASGAIGRLVVRALANDSRVGRVLAVVRSAAPGKAAGFWFLDGDSPAWAKVEVKLVPDVAQLDEPLPCDIGFCCIGLYTGNVKSEATFRAVEVGLNGKAARAMKAGGATRCCYLSGAGAGGSAPMFSRVKGAAEQELRSIGFDAFASFRPPGIMDRPGKTAYGCVEHCLNKMCRCCLSCCNLFVRAEDVAWAMLRFSFAPAAELMETYEAGDIKREALALQAEQNLTKTRFRLNT